MKRQRYPLKIYSRFDFDKIPTHPQMDDDKVQLSAESSSTAPLAYLDPASPLLTAGVGEGCGGVDVRELPSEGCEDYMILSGDQVVGVDVMQVNLTQLNTLTMTCSI